MAAPFVVGIDLGTTNSCLAWTAGGAPITIFPVDQLTPDGRAARSTLPSVLYAPITEERATEGGERFADPYCDAPWITGALARSRGEEVPGRSVTAAKSWLSHPSADPAAPSLPIGAPAGMPRLSAVDASARVLGHLVRAFEAATRRRVQDASVILTLPASFDEGARASTLESARRAGLKPALLEEPQAAFYDYMAQPKALDALLGKKADALVLVIDVGGGTTDLSLVLVARHESGIRCTRIATGDHLLLGGDNMDLALAALVRERLPDRELDAFRMGQLVQQCRVAKEALLAEEAPDSHPIALVQRGARLVGSTTTVRLSRTEVRRALLDGFFPEVEAGRLPAFRRAGLVAAGLPYARDTAITRHVARFLERYAEGRAPNAILLNGGVFRAHALRQAIARSVRSRTGARISLLEETDPDLAVARGAARYGVARLDGGLTIEAGATRSYYVGVAGGTAARAVCVVPRNTLEGVRCEVSAPALSLRTGELAQFSLFRARTGVVHEVGTLVDVSEKTVVPLRPLMTRIEGAAGQVQVTLACELTPIGTLALSLREVEGKRRNFSLSFEVKDGAIESKRVTPAPPSERASSPAPVTLSPQLRQAESLINTAFSFAAKDGRAAQELVRELEKLLGDRLSWNVLDARRLFDVVADKRSARKWTADHERAFWAIAGVCLRPGFGAPGDEKRAIDLASLAASGLTFADRAPVAQTYFIALRRVAAGFDSRTQQSLFASLAPRIGSRSAVAETEMRECLSFLERVDVDRKITLAERLVQSLGERPQPSLFVDLSRIATRVPTHADARQILPASLVAPWLAELPALDWHRPTLALAIVRMARVTDVDGRDLPRALRRRLAKLLVEGGVAADIAKPLEHFIPIAAQERSASFGDSLPPGLTLA